MPGYYKSAELQNFDVDSIRQAVRTVCRTEWDPKPTKIQVPWTEVSQLPPHIDGLPIEGGAEPGSLQVAF